MKRIGIILNAMTQLLGALLCVTLNSNEYQWRRPASQPRPLAQGHQRHFLLAGRSLPASGEVRNRRLPGVTAGLWLLR
jgi:hypothetical protein